MCRLYTGEGRGGGGGWAVERGWPGWWYKTGAHDGDLDPIGNCKYVNFAVYVRRTRNTENSSEKSQLEHLAPLALSPLRNRNSLRFSSGEFATWISLVTREIFRAFDGLENMSLKIYFSIFLFLVVIDARQSIGRYLLSLPRSMFQRILIIDELLKLSAKPDIKRRPSS